LRVNLFVSKPERSNAGQLNVRTCFACFCDVDRKHYM